MSVYPSIPGQRFSYDIDGTAVLVTRPGGSIAELSTAQKRKMIADTGADGIGFEAVAQGNGQPYGQMFFIFPEKRDLTGLYPNFSRGGFGGSGFNGPNMGSRSWYISTSQDTTNGFDGTWTSDVDYSSLLVQTAASGSSWGTVSNVSYPNNQTSPYDTTFYSAAMGGWFFGGWVTTPNYRSSIISLAGAMWLGVKGIRITFGTQGSSESWANVMVVAMHWFGSKTAGQTYDRAEFWHPTLDVPLSGSSLDWGDVPQGTTADKTFRIKNTSGTSTAQSIVLSLDYPTDASPSLASQYSLSSDGSSFSTSLNIGNLAAGALSGVLYIRRTTPSNAQQSVWSGRIQAQVGAWV